MKLRGSIIHIVVIASIVLLVVGAAAVAIAVHEMGGIHKSSSKKVAGKLVFKGKFNASKLDITSVAGRVAIVKGNTSGILVESNLPIRTSLKNGVLTVYCPEKNEGNLCDSYKNGTVVIEVGEHLSALKLDNTVGRVTMNVQVPSITASNTVGKMTLRASESVKLDNTVGTIKVVIPAGRPARVIADNIVGKVTACKGGEGRPVVVTVNNAVGSIYVEH